MALFQTSTLKLHQGNGSHYSYRHNSCLRMLAPHQTVICVTHSPQSDALLRTNNAMLGLHLSGAGVGRVSVAVYSRAQRWIEPVAPVAQRLAAGLGHASELLAEFSNK